MKAPVLLLISVLLTGCGSADGPTPKRDVLSGVEVGAMAERELEAAHPGMAPGTVTCPDLNWEVGASVRCTQVAELSGGRQISIGGNVSVTDLKDGGRLHVQLDDTVAEFGVSGDYLTADLEVRARSRLRPAPTSVTCPYLSGQVGTTVTCRVVHAGRTKVVLARVTAVVPANHETSYAFDWRLLDRR